MEIPNVVEAVSNLYASKSSSYPARSIWASKLGHPCARSIAYEQTAPEEKSDPSASLMMRFAIGNQLEQMTVRDMQDSLGPKGIRIEQQNVPIPMNPQNIGGKVDCVMIMPDRTCMPVEIKSMSPMVFGKIKNINDMYNSESTYMRCYPAQLMIYLYFTGCENGMFIFRNLNGGIDQLNITLDYEYTETLLKKAEHVNDCVQRWKKRHIANSTDPHCDDELPERIPFSGSVCCDCPFMSRCCPDMVGLSGVEDLIWDVELNALCKIREQNEEAAGEFDKADAKIKAHAKACAKDLVKGQTKTILTADYLIECKAGEITKYDIPDEIKKRFASKGDSFRTKIMKAK